MWNGSVGSLKYLPIKRPLHKMVKHTQTICRLLPFCGVGAEQVKWNLLHDERIHFSISAIR